jgi:hypothetical protein
MYQAIIIRPLYQNLFSIKCIGAVVLSSKVTSNDELMLSNVLLAFFDICVRRSWLLKVSDLLHL